MNRNIFYLFTLLLFLQNQHSLIYTLTCNLPISSLSPKIIQLQSQQFYTNNSTTFIKITTNTNILLKCDTSPGRQFQLLPNEPNNQILATCKFNQTLIVKSQEINFDDLRCQPFQLLTKQSSLSLDGCQSPFISVEIGYENPLTNLTHIIADVCYDSQQQNRLIFIRTIIRNFNNNFGRTTLRFEEINYFNKIEQNQIRDDFYFDSLPTGVLAIDLINFTQIGPFERLSMVTFFWNQFIGPDLIWSIISDKIKMYFSINIDGNSNGINDIGSSYYIYIGAHGISTDLIINQRYIPKYYWIAKVKEITPYAITDGMVEIFPTSLIQSSETIGTDIICENFLNSNGVLQCSDFMEFQRNVITIMPVGVI